MTAQFHRLIVWQVLRQIGRRPWLALLNVLSVALGIAVFLAIQIANRGANQAFSAAVDLVAGKAQIEVRGRVDETWWPVVARQPGVRGVTGLIEGVVTLPDFPGEYLRIVGLDVFTSEPFRTFELHAPEKKWEVEAWLGRPNGVAVTREFANRTGLEEGGNLRVLVDGEVRSLVVLSLLDLREAAGGAPSRFAAMDLGWAQELFGRVGRLDALQLLLEEPGEGEAVAERLRHVLPADLTVAAPRQRSLQIETLLSAFQLNLTALSMVSLLVGVFLIYNTIAASVTRRRVEIGILRALGATALEVRCLFLVEAACYGAGGIALGAIGGVALASVLTGAVAQTITSLYLLVSIEHAAPGVWQLSAAALCGFGAVLAGAWLPAAEAARVNPVQALSLGAHAEQSTARRGRWSMVAGALLLLAAGQAWAALRWRVPWLSFASAFCILCGFAFLSPAATAAFGWGAARCQLGLLWRLAADHLRQSTHRHAITVAALAAAVAMLAGLSTMIFSFRRSVGAWVEHGIIADLFIAPASNETVGLGAAVPPAALAWLRERGDVDSVDTYAEMRVPLRLSGGAAKTAPLAVIEGRYRGNLSFVGGRAGQKMEQVFAHGAVAVSEPFARKWGGAEGQRLTMTTPRGPADFTIAGVYTDYTRDEGVVLMARATYARYWDDARVQSLAVYLRPGAAPEAVADAFRSRFGASGEFSIYSNRALRERILSIFDQTFAVTYILRTVALVVAVAGIFLSTTTLVAEREREIGMLRALGASRGQVRAWLMLESAMIGLLSSLLGLAAGLVLAVDLTAVVNPVFFGWSIRLETPWISLAATPLWMAAVALLAAAWPADRASRLPIAQTVRAE